MYQFEKITKKYWLEKRNNQEGFNKIISRIKSKKKGKYDCILGLSGGIDSSYLLHYAVKELGLSPLVFHVDGGWNSDISVSNIKSLVSKLNLDLFTEVINWEEMRLFQLSFLKVVSLILIYLKITPLSLLFITMQITMESNGY